MVKFTCRFRLSWVGNCAGASGVCKIALVHCDDTVSHYPSLCLYLFILKANIIYNPTNNLRLLVIPALLIRFLYIILLHFYAAVPLSRKYLSPPIFYILHTICNMRLNNVTVLFCTKTIRRLREITRKEIPLIYGYIYKNSNAFGQPFNIRTAKLQVAHEFFLQVNRFFSKQINMPKTKRNVFKN